MKKRNVLYTVITNDYDFLLPPAIQPSVKNWDLICFTDNPDLKSSIWDVRPLPDFPEMAALADDPVRRARLVKILPHRFLSEYENSIYIDGNRVLDKDLDDFLAEFPGPLVCMEGTASDAYCAVDTLLKQPERKNELAVVEIPPLPEREKKLLKKQVERWKSKGMPANKGCPATFFLSRKHQDKKVIAVMESWAKEVLNGSSADEPALSFACFSNQYKWTGACTSFAQPGYLVSPAELIAVRAPHKKHLLGDNPPPVTEYPPNPPPPGGPYGGYPYLLTVGVPVSNQIGTIRRCLEHIKPLLDAVPSELVVVDTGSTDGTVEVCREFGARVVEFPWINDMSAARNTGIRAARSEWYISIDDDEWFEDVSPIIQFFTQKIYKNHQFAVYYQRNFGDVNEERFHDFPALRIFKVQSDSHFEGRIHDALFVNGKPFIIQAFARHSGFAIRTLFDGVRKALRNAALLRYDVAQHQYKLRYAYQMMREYYLMFQYDECYRYCYLIIALSREDFVDDLFLSRSLDHIVLVFLASRNFRRIEQFHRDHLDIDSYNLYDRLFLYYSFVIAAHSESDFSRCISYAAAYLKTRKEYLKLSDIELLVQSGSVTEDRSDEKNCAYVLIRMISAAEKMGNSSLINQCLSHPVLLNQFNESMPQRTLCMDPLVQNQNWPMLHQLYSYLQKKNYSAAASYILIYVLCLSLAEHLDSIHAAFSGEIESSDLFATLYAFVCSEQPDQAAKGAQTLLDRIGEFPLESRILVRYAILNICMKTRTAPEPFLEQMSVPDIDFIATQIDNPGKDTHALYTELIRWCRLADYTDGSITHYLAMKMSDLMFKGMNGEGNRASYLDQYNRYIDMHSAWSHSLYRPELLENTGANVLRSEEQTVCALQYARVLEQQQDYLGVVRLLRTALYNSPNLKPAISMVLSDLQAQMEEEEQTAVHLNPEFRALLAGVKHKIEQLIENGNGPAALPLLNQLETLSPGDSDIFALKKKAGLLH